MFVAFRLELRLRFYPFTRSSLDESSGINVLS